MTCPSHGPKDVAARDRRSALSQGKGSYASKPSHRKRVLAVLFLGKLPSLQALFLYGMQCIMVSNIVRNSGRGEHGIRTCHKAVQMLKLV